MDPLVRLYPGAWRRRYGEELAAHLADRPPGWLDRVDLVRGAVDAHLHPIAPATWPVAAAAIGGIAWTFAGAVVLGQPVPPDWPGYLGETLPVMLAAAPLLAIAGIGASTRLGDRAPAIVRAGRLAIVVASLAWTTLLVLALAGLVGGAPLAVAATVTAAGLLLVGVALLADGDALPACAMLVAALCLVAPVTWAALAYGIAWTAAAAFQLRDPRPGPRQPLEIAP
jgi:hypothetical protein